jgi:glycosyltransferase involved in cell wall biosynthesis
MHLLLLTPQLPYPPQQGTSLRNLHMLRGLAARFTVDLLSFREGGQPEQPDDMGPLPDLCRQIVTVSAPQRSTGQRVGRMLTDTRPDMGHRLQSTPYETALSEMLATNAYNGVQVEGIELARYLPIVRALRPEATLVFDDHNAEAELQYRAMRTDLPHPRRWPAAAYSAVQTRRLRRFEAWACRTADAVVAVSQADAAHLQTLVPELEPVVIPNCIDVHDYALDNVSDPPRFDLLLTGKMDYRPNIDAVLWFAREIWPLVRASRPETTWAVVGQQPHARLNEVKELPGVTVTGRVPHIQPYLAGASVFIMPYRLGSGTRLKLIEAMAASRAIVSTTIGAEGYPVAHGEPLLLADDPDWFANAVLDLLDNPEKRAKLGRAAQAFAQQYDWRTVTRPVVDLYARSIARGSPSSG